LRTWAAKCCTLSSFRRTYLRRRFEPWHCLNIISCAWCVRHSQDSRSITLFVMLWIVVIWSITGVRLDHVWFVRSLAGFFACEFLDCSTSTLAFLWAWKHGGHPKTMDQSEEMDFQAITREVALPALKQLHMRFACNRRRTCSAYMFPVVCLRAGSLDCTAKGIVNATHYATELAYLFHVSPAEPSPVNYVSCTFRLCRLGTRPRTEVQPRSISSRQLGERR
jgi:hypothetical protein